MSGTREGGKLAAETNRERYGANYYAELGRVGGRACVPKGFAANPELARRAGAKGGAISRRSKNEAKETEAE